MAHAPHDDHGFPHAHAHHGVGRAAQFRASVLLLAFLLLAGTTGFYVLGEGRTMFECLYLTCVILTTVGMKEESHPLNHKQQAFAILLMLAGISTALYATTNLVAFMIEGDMGRLFGRRQLENKIRRLEGHYVVCGFGRMGRALCEALRAKDAPFLLIEKDPLKTADADRLGYLYVGGDAMSEPVLRAARIECAQGLASCLGSDADNVFVTLSARELNAKLTIIARGEQPDTEAKLRRAGADRVIVPPVLGARKVMRMLLSPAVDELMEAAGAGSDLEISKVELSELASAVGRSLRDLSLPSRTGLIVVALVHADGRREFNPPPDAVLAEGDEVIVMGPAGGVEKMVALLGQREKRQDRSDRQERPAA